jgi:hypothetical protein
MIASFDTPPFYVGDTRTAVITVQPRRSFSAAIGLHPDWRWQLYLDELPDQNHRVRPEHVSAVRSFWSAAKGRLGFSLPVPVTQPTSEGAIQLVWDRGRHYIDVDVFADGHIAWFYKNNETGSRAGTDEELVTVDDLPQGLLQRLRLLRG